MDPQVLVLLKFPLPRTINAGEENLPVRVSEVSLRGIMELRGAVPSLEARLGVPRGWRL